MSDQGGQGLDAASINSEIAAREDKGDQDAAGSRVTSAGGAQLNNEQQRIEHAIVPLNLQDSLNAIQLFFPAGCYTLFQVSLTQHHAVSKACMVALADVAHLAVGSNTDNRERRLRQIAGKCSQPRPVATPPECAIVNSSLYHAAECALRHAA